MSHSLLLIGLRLFPVRMKIKPFVKAGSSLFSNAGTYFNLYLNRVTASFEVSLLVNDAQQKVIIPNKMKAQKDYVLNFRKNTNFLLLPKIAKRHTAKHHFPTRFGRHEVYIQQCFQINYLFARYHFIERNHHRINFNLKTRL